MATGTSPNSDAFLDDQTGQRRDSTKRQCLGLTPSLGTSHSCHGPNWLGPSAGQPMRGTSPELKRKRDGAICASVRPSRLDLGPSASCGVPSTSEQLCHWLNPSAGQQPSRRPPSKHKGRREQRPHWLCAGLGKGIIIICGRAWRSAFRTVRGAEMQQPMCVAYTWISCHCS